MRPPPVKLGYKLWLDRHGKAFGDGPYELLRRVEKTGSLHRAALDMGMSYNKAWRLMGILEKRLGFPLLERKTGGIAGGGSRLTPEGKKMMDRYGRFRKEADRVLRKVFKDHFQKV
ncbi:MAG: LysR family transcriptional regulator [Desulfobacterota bacterium]|nr:LysR family transcriptional regulator [Thermodesulfobacteriota bacterium]